MKTLCVLGGLQLIALCCLGHQAWELHERTEYPWRIAALVTLSMAIGLSWSGLYDVYKLRRYMWRLSRKAATSRTNAAKARAAQNRTILD